MEPFGVETARFPPGVPASMTKNLDSPMPWESSRLSKEWSDERGPDDFGSFLKPSAGPNYRRFLDFVSGM